MSKRKLLLADDSVTIQKVVNLTFADEGIEVISVGDGDSAMEKVAEVSPDLIMADVNMPGLTGYEICERIRQDDNLRQTPVILLVGSFEPFDEDEARRVGADDYLTKPFQSIRQLVNKVTVLLDAKNGENGVEVNNASSLEDTLEMDVSEVAVPAPVVAAGFDDTGYDDEMIQTNHPVGFAFDETQKFESREAGELANPSQFETSSETIQELSYSENKNDIIADEVLETQTVKPKNNEFGENAIESENASTAIKDEDFTIERTSDYAFSNEPKQNDFAYNEKEETVYEIKDEDNSSDVISDKTESSEFVEEENLASEIETKNYLDEVETSETVSYEIKEESATESLEDEVVSDEVEQSETKFEKTEDISTVSDEIAGEETSEKIEENQETLNETEVETPLEKTEDLTETSVETETEILDEVADSDTLENIEEISEEDKEENIYESFEEKEEISTDFSEDSEETVDSETVENNVAEELEFSKTDSDLVKDYEFVSDESIERIGSEDSFEAEVSNEDSEVADSIESEVEGIVDSSEQIETQSDSAVESESENVGFVQKTYEEEIPLPEFASVLELDDDDILQLPPFENEIEVEENIESAKESKVNYSANSLGFAAPFENKSAIDSTQISDDLIELIVAKVLERLSENAVKEVAWEVVPQMTELIVTKMAEEKLKK